MTTILGTLLTLIGLVVGVPLAGAALLGLLSLLLWVAAVSVDERARCREKVTGAPQDRHARRTLLVSKSAAK